MQSPRFVNALQDVSARMQTLLQEEKLPSVVRPDYLAAAVTAYPERGGKRLRPALTMWFCGAAGGEPGQAVHVGLAVELYHNWTLIHDDIIDDDSLRRGGETCHVMLADADLARSIRNPEVRRRFGRDMAILAGDILHAWSINLVGRAVADGVAPEVVTALLGRLTGWVTPELISGEALDVEYAYRTDLGVEEVETMLLMKTGILLQFAAEAGVMIARQSAALDHPMVRQASTFAARAGLAFQLQDDVLGIFGDQERLGKPVCSDLIEGKRTVLLLKALEAANATQKKRLGQLLNQTELTPADVADARDILQKTGARDWTRKRAAELVEDARSALQAFDDNRYKNLLLDWLDFVINRET